MDNIEQLVAQAVSGDKLAFEQLYQQTYRSVYFTCISLLKNQDDALDMTQETYLAAFRNIQKLQDYACFVPWLVRIAVNNCKNLMKRNKVVYVDDENLDSLQLEEREDFLPEEYASNQAKRKIVMDIMHDKLSDVLYHTVILYYFDGLTVPEIAEVMECPTGTVTYRLSVARGKIKQGVLQYENKSHDKIYAHAGVPFLASLLVMQAQNMYMPYIAPEKILNLIGGIGATVHPVVNGGSSGAVGQAASKHILHSLQAKIIAGIVAGVVVIGGTAIIIHNVKTKDNTAISTSTEATSELVEKDQETTELTTTDIATTEVTTTEITTEEDTIIEAESEAGTEVDGSVSDTVDGTDMEGYKLYLTNEDAEDEVYAEITVSLPEKYSNYKVYGPNEAKTMVRFADEWNHDLQTIYIWIDDGTPESWVEAQYDYAENNGGVCTSGTLTNDENREYSWAYDVVEKTSEYDRYLYFVTPLRGYTGEDKVLIIQVSGYTEKELELEELSELIDSHVVNVKEYGAGK
ncbi:MAG: RNA polymerase sigma factor [Coprococcus sp.]